MRHQAFITLALHAKMHRQLDALDARQALMERIEREEIRAYDNDDEFGRLEAMKKELLAIRFVDASAR